MPPVELNSVPHKEEARRSVTDLKVVEKVMGIPAVCDTVHVVANAISENAHVQSAKRMVDGGMKAISDNKDFKETVENVRNNKTVNLVADAVGPKLAGAMDTLDKAAAHGVDNLTNALPSLSAPTNELVENTKEAAWDYYGNVKEYLASFKVGQMSLRVVDTSLSVVERGASLLGAKEKQEVGVVNRTYSSIRRRRRAVRALRRAGERRFALSTNALTKAGLVGSFASMLAVNTFLRLVGLELVAKSSEQKRIEKRSIEPTEPLDSAHTHISDIKGDLSGYKSEEDPDYEPNTSDESVDESTSDSESEEEAKDEIDEGGESNGEQSKET